MKHARLLATAVLAVALSATTAAAQDAIPVMKDRTVSYTTSGGDVAIDWTGPLGYTLRPGAPAIWCGTSDRDEATKIAIESDLYQPGMITPDQAKGLALCAVPGQISSGEMATDAGRTHYDITILPTDKKTYTKVQIDAYTGEVINAKQFGGLRGLAGFLRESVERDQNKQP